MTIHDRIINGSFILRLLVSFLSVVVTHLEVEEHLPCIVAFVKEVQVIWRKKEVSAFSSATT